MVHLATEGEGVVCPVHAGTFDHVHLTTVEHVEDGNREFSRVALLGISSTSQERGGRSNQSAILLLCQGKGEDVCHLERSGIGIEWISVVVCSRRPLQPVPGLTKVKGTHDIAAVAIADKTVAPQS